MQSIIISYCKVNNINPGNIDDNIFIPYKDIYKKINNIFFSEYVDRYILEQLLIKKEDILNVSDNIYKAILNLIDYIYKHYDIKDKYFDVYIYLDVKDRDNNISIYTENYIENVLFNTFINLNNIENDNILNKIKDINISKIDEKKITDNQYYIQYTIDNRNNNKEKNKVLFGIMNVFERVIDLKNTKLYIPKVMIKKHRIYELLIKTYLYVLHSLLSDLFKEI